MITPVTVVPVASGCCSINSSGGCRSITPVAVVRSTSPVAVVRLLQWLSFNRLLRWISFDQLRWLSFQWSVAVVRLTGGCRLIDSGGCPSSGPSGSSGCRLIDSSGGCGLIDSGAVVPVSGGCCPSGSRAVDLAPVAVVPVLLAQVVVGPVAPVAVVAVAPVVPLWILITFKNEAL